MGRPKKEPRERRSHLLGIWITDEERAAVSAQAIKAGRPPASFARAVLFDRLPNALPSASPEAQRCAHELGRIGNNLNQLTRSAHINGMNALDRAQLRDTIQRLQLALDKLMP